MDNQNRYIESPYDYHRDRTSSSVVSGSDIDARIVRPGYDRTPISSFGKKPRRVKRGGMETKTKIIILVFVLAILGIAAYFGIREYQTYLYHQTYEYKLLEHGYDELTVARITENLNDSNIDWLLEQDENYGFLNVILGQDYFLQRCFKDYCAYYTENPNADSEDVIACVNVGATRDWYEDTEETDISLGALMLVNKFHVLPENYSVKESNLKNVADEYYSFDDEYLVDEAYDALMEMIHAAEKEVETPILVTSGYRTYEDQEATYQEYVDDGGKSYADKYAARPGASEHETGYAVDIFEYYSTTDSFSNTDLYKWLKKHAAEYGFIERYPKGKENITGFSAESWHYRYVGVEAATKIKELGITFDEYYAYYIIGDDEESE